MARPQEFETNEVLQNAMYVFWNKGYEAASLNEILAATGLSKSSLYATFGNKRALFLAAFEAYRKERLWGSTVRLSRTGQKARRDEVGWGNEHKNTYQITTRPGHVRVCE